MEYPTQASSADAPINLIHHTLRRGGGKERYALALATAFRQLGRRVNFYCLEADEAVARELGIDFKVVSVPMRPRRLQDYRFYRRMSALVPGIPGLQIGLSRVPARDVHVSGGTHRGYVKLARKARGPFDYLRFWLEAKTYSAARLVIAHSDLLHDQVRGLYGISPARVRTLYAPVDDRFLPPRFSARREELRSRFHFPAQKVVFLFPSSGHGRKGLRPILEAMSFFKSESRLVLAGKRGPSGPAACDYLGYVENLADAYFAADYTILGSYYEPFGLVGPESLLSGTRLVFEERVGCLAAVNREYVSTFSVWDQQSIRNCLGQVIELARIGGHRNVDANLALRYDPSPLTHARKILSFLGETVED